MSESETARITELLNEFFSLTSTVVDAAETLGIHIQYARQLLHSHEGFADKTFRVGNKVFYLTSWVAEVAEERRLQAESRKVTIAKFAEPEEEEEVVPA